MKKETSRIITDDSAPDKTIVAYVRCSTIEQNEHRQLEALKDVNPYKTFIEKASAKDTDRPVLKQLLEYIREGDTVYITDFSRLARSTKDLLELTERLEKQHIKLVSLKENLDTGTPTGKMLLTMIGAINTFERECLLERQREGIKIAQRAGKYKGRKRIEKPPQWDEVYPLYKNRSLTATEAMSRLCLKRNTFYNFVKQQLQA